MKNILIALVVAVIGFFLGRATVKEQIVHISMPVNIDSLKDVWLKGIPKPKPEIVISHLRGQNHIIRDTVWRSDTWDEVPYYEASLDTVLTARAFIIQGEDTLRRESEIKTHINMGFVGEPTNSFILSRMRLEPFVFELPVKERVVDANNTFGLNIVVGSRLTTGLIFSYDWLGLGWEYHPYEQKSEIKAQFRVVSF